MPSINGKQLTGESAQDLSGFSAALKTSFMQSGRSGNRSAALDFTPSEMAGLINNVMGGCNLGEVLAISAILKFVTQSIEKGEGGLRVGAELHGDTSIRVTEIAA